MGLVAVGSFVPPAALAVPRLRRFRLSEMLVRVWRWFRSYAFGIGFVPSRLTLVLVRRVWCWLASSRLALDLVVLRARWFRFVGSVPRVGRRSRDLAEKCEVCVVCLPCLYSVPRIPVVEIGRSPGRPAR